MATAAAMDAPRRRFRVVAPTVGTKGAETGTGAHAVRRALRTFSGPAATELVSLARTGDTAQTGESGDLSAGGKYVVYASNGTNLVPNDNNGKTDVFRRDRDLGVNVRVSVSTAGGQANAGSVQPTISGNGRFVAFFSSASNLVGQGADTNALSDVFIREITADDGGGTTTRASVSASGVQANGASESPTLSYDGRRVAFISTASNLVAGDTNRALDAS